MKRDGVDFAEALRVLAQRTGVELKPRTPEEQERDDNLGHLRQLLDTAVTYYHHLLKNAPGAAAARDHLAGRGLTAQAIEMFQLGYAPEAWDAALKYFTGKDYAQQDLLDAGLIVVKEEDERVFDRFRDRLMIPVRDERGRMTGFQARALKPDALPKFMNSPQTALFDKGRTLFGLDRARKAIREAEAAIVVEGNLDVMAAHQAGFENVVSSQGTALTEHQMRLLKKYARRIILALDADAAGNAATLRGLSVAREALDREAEIVFDPRGLVRTEGRLGADIRVMTLPARPRPGRRHRPRPGRMAAPGGRRAGGGLRHPRAHRGPQPGRPQGQDRGGRPGAAADRRRGSAHRARHLPPEAGPHSARGRARAWSVKPTGKPRAPGAAPAGPPARPRQAGGRRAHRKETRSTREVSRLEGVCCLGHPVAPPGPAV